MIDNLLNSSIQGSTSTYGIRSTHADVLSERHGGFEDILASYLGRLLAEKGDPSLLFDERGESHQEMIDEIEENARQQRQVRREQQQSDIERKRRFSELREEDTERLRRYQTRFEGSDGPEGSDPGRILNELLKSTRSTGRNENEVGSSETGADTDMDRNRIAEVGRGSRVNPVAGNGNDSTDESGWIGRMGIPPGGAAGGSQSPSSAKSVLDAFTATEEGALPRAEEAAYGRSGLPNSSIAPSDSEAAHSETIHSESDEYIVRAPSNSPPDSGSDALNAPGSPSEPDPALGSSESGESGASGFERIRIAEDIRAGGQSPPESGGLVDRVADFVEETLETLKSAVEGIEEVREAFDDVIEHLESLLERIRTAEETDTPLSGETMASFASREAGIDGRQGGELLNSMAAELEELQELLEDAFQQLGKLPDGESIVDRIEQTIAVQPGVNDGNGVEGSATSTGATGLSSARPDGFARQFEAGRRAPGVLRGESVVLQGQPGAGQVQPGAGQAQPVAGQAPLAGGAQANSENRVSGETQDRGSGSQASGRAGGDVGNRDAGRMAQRTADDTSTERNPGDLAQRAASFADRLRNAARLVSGDSGQASSGRELVFDVRDFRRTGPDGTQPARGADSGGEEVARDARIESEQDGGAAPPRASERGAEISSDRRSESANRIIGDTPAEPEDSAVSDERERFDVLLGREENAQSRGATPSGNAQPASAGSDARSQLEQMLREQGNSEIVRQARVILKDDHAGELRLTLKPERLGSVRIRMELEDNRVDLRILVENSNVRDAFRETLTELQQSFEAEGFDIGQFSVDVNDSNGEGSESGGYRETRSGIDHRRGDQARAMDELSESVPSADPYGGSERHVNVMV